MTLYHHPVRWVRWLVACLVVTAMLLAPAQHVLHALVQGKSLGDRRFLHLPPQGVKVEIDRHCARRGNAAQVAGV